MNLIIKSALSNMKAVNKNFERDNFRRKVKNMDLIDRNYLLKNIISWGKLVKGNDAKKLLTEVINYIQAQDTIVDMQKLIDGVNFQKIGLEYLDDKDIKGATIYNGAIDDGINEIKNAMNPNYIKAFDWDKTEGF